MDPVAHTLVGAALAETGLKRRTRLATVTLLIGANLPDVDAFVAWMVGDGSERLVRRGWSHGVLAWVVLPWLLAGGVLLFERLRRRYAPRSGNAQHSGAGGATDEGAAEPPPFDFRWLLALSYTGVLSHPFLDWLNTWGIRLLMPFSGTWFHGDTLFIVDPWMWLLAGSSVFLARSRKPVSLIAWALLALATSNLVLFSDRAPDWVRAPWLVALAVLIVARVKTGPSAERGRLARVTLAMLAAYILGMFTLGRFVEARVADWLAERGVETEDVIAMPTPANPFLSNVVGVAGDRYHFVESRLFGEPALRTSAPPLGRLDPEDPIVAAALDATERDGFRLYMRLPAGEVTRLQDGGYEVRFQDARRGRPGRARRVVTLGADLRPAQGLHPR